ncbi:MAG: cation transporting ATPase C-terminal domain-containing protein [Huintestinicola sp.]
MTVLYTVLLGLPMPFTAVQLLFINLLTDSLPAIAISMEKEDGGVMTVKPRDPDEGIMTGKMAGSMLSQAVLLALGTVFAYHIGLRTSPEAASTMAFAALCLGRLFGCFNCRGEKPLIKLGLLSNPFAAVAFLAGALFLAAAVFITPLHSVFNIAPLGGSELMQIVVLALAPTVIIQICKTVRYIVGKR